MVNNRLKDVLVGNLGRDYMVDDTWRMESSMNLMIDEKREREERSFYNPYYHCDDDWPYAA